MFPFYVSRSHELRMLCLCVRRGWSGGMSSQVLVNSTPRWSRCARGFAGLRSQFHTTWSRFQTSWSQFHTTGVRSPLLLYGLAAFVWERERISDQEVIRCLKVYEDRVKSQLGLQEPTSLHSIPHGTKTGLLTSHDTNQKSCGHHQTPSLSAAEGSTMATSISVQQSQFEQELKSLLQQHSFEHLSSLPLVGMRHDHLSYRLSYKVTDSLSFIKSLVSGKSSSFKHMPLVGLKHDPLPYKLSFKLMDSLSFVRTFISGAISQSSLLQNLSRTFTPQLTNVQLQRSLCDHQSSFIAESEGVLYLESNLLHIDQSKLVTRFLKAVQKLNRSQKTVRHSFDNVLGIDGLQQDIDTMVARSNDVVLTKDKDECQCPTDADVKINGLSLDGLGELDMALKDSRPDCQWRVDDDSVSLVPLLKISTKASKRGFSSKWSKLAKSMDVRAMVAGVTLRAGYTATESGMEMEVMAAGGRKSCREGATASGRRETCGEGERATAGGRRQREKTDVLSALGWEQMAKQSNCTVYKKLYRDTGLFQYKVIGTYSDITARDFYDVQVDNEARKLWDSYVLRLETVDADPRSGCEIVHWVLKYPFPMSSREYVFMRKAWVSGNEDAIVLINRSVSHPRVPEGGRYVRVKSYFSEMVIKPHTFIDVIGFDYELTYFDDPQSYLPSSCVNWVTTTAMPDFLSRIHSAAVSRGGYPTRTQVQAL